MSVAVPRAGSVPKSSNVQYAALPYRVNGAQLEILLVTSKHNRRWIIPKGWPIEGLPPHAGAAREALEEAGVSGDVESIAVGFFHYFKTLKGTIIIPCKVEVFALKVTRCRKAWAEKDARDRRWCSIDEAVAAVVEPELRRLIRKFASRQGS
jgi:8-oxo-dGTP pyrophosphatase MutT (NUDIX family)